jgi:hypothetical protein
MDARTRLAVSFSSMRPTISLNVVVVDQLASVAHSFFLVR